MTRKFEVMVARMENTILTIALASNVKMLIEKLSRSRETMAYQIMCRPLM
jgi:hypothetical protein